MARNMYTLGYTKVQEQAFSEDRKGTMVVHGW